MGTCLRDSLLDFSTTVDLEEFQLGFGLLESGRGQKGRLVRHGAEEINSYQALVVAQAHQEELQVCGRLDRLSVLTVDSDTVAGLEAYKRHDWKQAYRLLSPLAESDRETPEVAEAIGSASWWLGDVESPVNARQRAYSDYLRADRPIDAAQGGHPGGRGPHAPSSIVHCQWLAEQGAPTSRGCPCPWPSMAISSRLESVLAGSLEEATKLSVKVNQIGVDVGDLDLEMLGLHDGGRFLVASGELDRGMARMEEAMISAVAGELSPKVTGRIFCNMIETCASMADYRRAIEWSDQTMRWCEGMGSAGGYPGICRVRRSGVHASSWGLVGC